MAELNVDKDALVGVVNGARHERANPTENYVHVPPALFCVDSSGNYFTFGTEYVIHHGDYEWNVVCNGKDTGETAKRISCIDGKVTIHGSYGRKQQSRSRRTFI